MPRFTSPRNPSGRFRWRLSRRRSISGVDGSSSDSTSSPFSRVTYTSMTRPPCMTKRCTGKASRSSLESMQPSTSRRGRPPAFDGVDAVGSVFRGQVVHRYVLQGAAEGRREVGGVRQNVSGQDARAGAHLDHVERRGRVHSRPHLLQLNGNQRAKGRVRGGRCVEVPSHPVLWVSVVSSVGVVESRLHEVGKGDSAPFPDEVLYSAKRAVGHAALPPVNARGRPLSQGRPSLGLLI